MRDEAGKHRNCIESPEVTDRVRGEARLWLAQRASAAVLAICVIVHLITIIYATRGGLSGAEILARTRGNGAWLSFYFVFVLAIAVHVPIGLRAIATEWLDWTDRPAIGLLTAFGIALLVMGFGADVGVVFVRVETSWHSTPRVPRGAALRTSRF